MISREDLINMINMNYPQNMEMTLEECAPIFTTLDKIMENKACSLTKKNNLELDLEVPVFLADHPDTKEPIEYEYGVI